MKHYEYFCTSKKNLDVALIAKKATYLRLESYREVVICKLDIEKSYDHWT